MALKLYVYIGTATEIGGQGRFKNIRKNNNTN